LFFYGLKEDQEATIELSAGKTILVKYMYQSGVNDSGFRTVYFKLNGQTRAVEVKDRNAIQIKKENPKAQGKGQLGSPLQGLLSKIMVKEGEVVSKNQALFIIEAMKMETTVVAPEAGKVTKIGLAEGTLVEPEDFVVEVG